MEASICHERLFLNLADIRHALSVVFFSSSLGISGFVYGEDEHAKYVAGFNPDYAKE
jgi:hypothetical protein